jgi:hypothetical protein
MPTLQPKSAAKCSIMLIPIAPHDSALGILLRELQVKTQELGNPKGDACILISAEQLCALFLKCDESEKAMDLCEKV